MELLTGIFSPFSDSIHIIVDKAVSPEKKMTFTIIHSVLTSSHKVVENRILHFIRLGIFSLSTYGEESRDLDFAGA